MGDPRHGRVMGVLTVMTGQPRWVSTVPVPDPGGGRPTAHVYHREPGPGRREERRTRFVFVHDPQGLRPD